MARHVVRDHTGDDWAGASPKGSTRATESTLSGGRSLAVRQAIGLVVGGGGSFVILRFIGPSSYGVYAAAFEIAFIAQTVAEFSLDLFLVRRAEMSQEIYDTVASLLAVSALASTALLFALLPLFAYVVRLHDFVPVALAMFLTLPVVHAQQVPLSRLERELRYVQVSRVEIAAQLAFPVLSIPLALAGAGVWAPVAGWWGQQLLLLVGFWWASPARPAWRWHPTEIKEALHFGTATTAATASYAGRNLVGPLLLSRLLGASAVGYVSLIQRILDSLALAKQVIYRMSISLLSKIIADRERLRRAVGDGLLLQAITVGVPVVAFAATAPWLVPVVFGASWRPAAEIFPLVAASYLSWSAFSAETATLLNSPRPWVLVGLNATNAGLLWIGCIAFVPVFGLHGYADGELLSILSVAAVHVTFVRRFGPPKVGTATLWLVALCGASMLTLVTPYAAALALVPLLIPDSRRQLVRLGVRAGVLHARRPSGATLGKRAREHSGHA